MCGRLNKVSFLKQSFLRIIYFWHGNKHRRYVSKWRLFRGDQCRLVWASIRPSFLLTHIHNTCMFKTRITVTLWNCVTLLGASKFTESRSRLQADRPWCRLKLLHTSNTGTKYEYEHCTLYKIKWCRQCHNLLPDTHRQTNRLRGILTDPKQDVSDYMIRWHKTRDMGPLVWHPRAVSSLTSDCRSNVYESPYLLIVPWQTSG